MLSPTVWVILGILVILVDLHTVNFITPIGIGLITLGITEYIGIDIYAGIITAIIVTIITYYPFFKFVHRGTTEKQATPEDEYVGKKAKVVEVIDDDEVRVEVGGEIFYAIIDKPAKVGDKVIIRKVEGVKLIVEKIE